MPETLDPPGAERGDKLGEIRGTRARSPTRSVGGAPETVGPDDERAIVELG